MPEKVDFHACVGEHLGIGQTVDELLARMDERKIATSVVSPMGKDLILGVAEANADLARAVREHPDQLIGFGAVNPWYDDALDMMETAVKKQGLRGFVVDPGLQGFPINHEFFHPLARKAADLAVPIYIRAGTPPHALPYQISDLASRCPMTTFVMGCMRSDFWFDVTSAASLVGNLYIDTTAIFLEAPLRDAVEKLGPERVLFATSSPYIDYAGMAGRLALAALDPEAMEAVCRGNAARLLGLAGGKG